MHVPDTWRWSAAVQTTGWLPVHVPLSHVSVCVHAFPSLHAVPSGLAGFEHVPLAGSHVPAAWHWSAAVQTTGWLPVHVPLSHVSVCVHAFPSLHAVPSGLAGFEHVPVAGLLAPAAWHWSATLHTTGSLPTQARPSHQSA